MSGLVLSICIFSVLSSSINCSSLRNKTEQNDISLTEYRGFSSAINPVKIPLGPFMVGIEYHQDRYEISLLKRDDGSRGDRKHLQMFVPAFMVASQIGWYLLAFKLVSVLAVKALLFAKLAFLVASIVTIKKFMMESMNHGPAITPYLDHVDPYMVPYDFSTFGQADLHPLTLTHLGHHDSNIHQSGSLAAESSVNSVTDTSNTASNKIAQTASIQSSSLTSAPKTFKRSDYYFSGTAGNQPYITNYRLKSQLNPFGTLLY